MFNHFTRHCVNIIIDANPNALRKWKVVRHEWMHHIWFHRCDWWWLWYLSINVSVCCLLSSVTQNAFITIISLVGWMFWKFKFTFRFQFISNISHRRRNNSSSSIMNGLAYLTFEVKKTPFSNNAVLYNNQIPINNSWNNSSEANFMAWHNWESLCLKNIGYYSTYHWRSCAVYTVLLVPFACDGLSLALLSSHTWIIATWNCFCFGSFSEIRSDKPATGMHLMLFA